MIDEGIELLQETIGGTPVLTAMHKFKVKSSARIKF
jgi:hypothetical protein